jgi:hypothetical protein
MNGKYSNVGNADENKYKLNIAAAISSSVRR